MRGREYVVYLQPSLLAKFHRHGCHIGLDLMEGRLEFNIEHQSMFIGSLWLNPTTTGLKQADETLCSGTIYRAFEEIFRPLHFFHTLLRYSLNLKWIKTRNTLFT